MKKLVLILLIFPALLYAQENKPYMIGKDTLVASNGMKFYKDLVLKIGRPAENRSQFTYLTMSPTWTALSGDYDDNGFGKDYAGRDLTVKKLKKQSSKKHGDKYFVIGSTSVVGCWIDIESAIASGEIVIPDEFKTHEVMQVQSVNTLSVADELKKLKELLDEGILSQEEFDKQKAKLLGN